MFVIWSLNSIYLSSLSSATVPALFVAFSSEVEVLLAGDILFIKPLLKFERLLETYYAFAPKGLTSFLKAIPVWLKEKMFLKKQLLDGLKEVGEYDKKKVKFLFPEHHLSHAASTFFTSPYEESAILTIDGVGEWCTASIAY